MAAGADGHEEITALHGVVDAIQVQGQLAEPDDVGAHPACLAGGAAAGLIHVPRPRVDGAAAEAAASHQLAVHVQELPGAGAVVQVIHILGDQEEGPGPGALQPRQGEVRGVLPSTEWKRNYYKRPEQKKWFANARCAALGCTVARLCRRSL